MMAKGFPYFKFTATEWLTGDIVFEDFELQGIFINVCALYWHRDGKLTVDEIEKRLKTDRLANLTDRFFSVSDGFISIKFLDEQLIAAGHISTQNSINGSKGGRPKTTLPLQIKPTAKRPLSDRKAKKSKEEEEEEKELNKIRSEKFENFWVYYERHGSKEDAMKAFMKLTESDLALMRIHLPLYLKNNPEKKFRKHAERYLSKKLWQNGDIEELSKKAVLPKDWWNMELTPEQWELLTPTQVREKKNSDMRKQMGV